MHGRLVCAAAVAACVLAGCGGSDESTAAKSSGDAGGKQEMAMGAMAMTSLAATTEGDVKVGLEAMPPETFFVAVGGEQRKHAPTERDDAHMMVTLADAKSGIRLPDATVTLRLTGPDGRTAYDGPLYPMIGRGMGMHYGENVPLPSTGRYEAQLIAGPPRIGRHRDSEGAWSKTLRLKQSFTWDGKTVTPAS